MRQERMYHILGLLAVSLLLAAGCTTPTPPVTPTPTITMTMTSPPTTIPATTAPATTVPITTATATVTATMTQPGAVTIGLVAKNLAFNTSVISVPACSNVTINFENQDGGVPHNFALYTSNQRTANLFKGQIITGPSSMRYMFTAPCTPGDYHFQCDPHSGTMFGTFRVF